MEKIISELFGIIKIYINGERDDYIDGVVDGLIIAIKTIDSCGESVGKNF